MRIVPGSAAFAATPGAEAASLAVAIGNFDGVHRGHQVLLAETRRRAESRGAESAVLTFTPHPARLFVPERAPPLIMSLARRLELCAEAGIDLAIVEPFSHAFAAIEADAFVRDVLRRDLDARDVIVGYDFSFGRGRTGDTRRLTALGAALDMGVAVIPQVMIGELPCSSTKIRELVLEGRTVEAAALLGRPFEIEGRVVRGAARGRTLGFPTANVAPEGELTPRLGIYAARGRLLEGPEAAAGTVHPVALSVGRNPTFNPTFGQPGQRDGVTVEAHLLDFEGDLYDRRMRIEVGQRLRDERRFDSIAALVAQIQADVEQVRRLQ
jgi:riboflavin kinase / FMN adenylyltransferase